MRITDIIAKKRNGQELTKQEIQFFVQSYVSGDIQDYHAAALLMAIYFQKMSFTECSALTEAMRYSGEVLTFDGIYTVDKHSTGGVGDKLSFIMAPIFSAAGGYTPMTSGRGLGHTGGTLDKLESIAGINVRPSIKEGLEILNKHGLVYMGQTETMAPADRKLYSLRDVTATVESIDLITSSILSKKYAHGIVFDVKCGAGAFMSNFEDAKRLAQQLVNVSVHIPQEAVAVITNMNQPLGRCVGNGLEIQESVAVLRGEEIEDLVEISLVLAGHMLVLAKITPDFEAGYQKAKEVLASGAAYEKFKETIATQGGDVSYLENPEKLTGGAKVTSWQASSDGYIQSINAREIGRAAIFLGGGRNNVADSIDHTVGFVFQKKVGDKVKAGDTIVEIYHQDKGLEEAQNILSEVILVGEEAPKKEDYIYEVVTAQK